MTAQPTILLVDGFAKDRSLYCRYLKREPCYDYRVVELAGGEAALEFCRHSMPDLIVVSDRLPDMDGVAFIHSLKQQVDRSIPPIVMVAGQTDETLMLRAMQEGVQDYLLKNQLTGEVFRRSIYMALEQVLLLRNSQSRFQKLAANVPGVIYQYLRQPNGTETMPYISPSIQELCELDAETVMQDMQQIWKLIHPEDVQKIQRSTDVSTTTLKPWQDEFRLTTPSGKLKWIQGIGRPEQLQDGSILWDGLLIEITALKRIEHTLYQQIERERLITAITQRIRETIDLPTILKTTVVEVQNCLGADRVLVYRTHQPCTHQDEICEGKTCHKSHSQGIAESLRSDLPSLLHLPLPDDGFIPCYHTESYSGCVCIVDNREQVSKFPIFHEFLRQAAVKSAVLVAIQQPDRLWGFLVVHQCHTNREWQPWEIQLLEQLADQLAIVIQQSELYEQLQVELKEREWVQAQLQQMNDQLLANNEQLAQATSMKDEFLANMSHELRTPLNAILGMTEGLLDEACGSITEKQKKAITIIERSGRHLLELINDILDLAKIEAGKLDLQITLVPIKRLCATSLNLVSPLAFKKNIELIAKIPEELGGIQVDERRMQQVLINLLSNAIKFTPDGGSVTLEVSIELIPDLQPETVNNAQITFSVIDTGIGIDAKNINFLFRSFVQIDSNLNRQYAGTGLGLALVKRLVELHQGTVSVKSTPGEGSCFMVHLPYHFDLTKLGSAVKLICKQIGLEETDATVLSASVGRQPQQFVGQTQLGAPLILLAEDDEANIEAVSNHLIRQGYGLVIARNGLEVVSLAKHRKPHLILMDIQMPVVDGLEAIYLIRTYHDLTSTPIIAMTALVMPGDREKCLAAGANDYLAKPINLKQLTDLIQQRLQPVKS